MVWNCRDAVVEQTWSIQFTSKEEEKDIFHLSVLYIRSGDAFNDEDDQDILDLVYLVNI